MGRLIDGEWSTEWYEPDEEGRFVRPDTVFRGTVDSPEAGQFHLYVSLACPWAHRTLLMRVFKGLEDAISVTVVDPIMRDEGWVFSERYACTPDPLFGKDFLREIYLEADPKYTGRVTVPILWDKKAGTIVNNESREIIRMLNDDFNSLSTSGRDLSPAPLRDRIDETMTAIYQPINNGVYRAGFATSQEAYEEGVTELFDALKHWEQVLSEQRYLCGDMFTEADICFFTTLFRFDIVYYTHFKCNLHHIWDFPNIWNFLKEVYQMPGVAETCSVKHIKTHYFGSHAGINPHYIIPVGPVVDFSAPHNRG